MSITMSMLYGLFLTSMNLTTKLPVLAFLLLSILFSAHTQALDTEYFETSVTFLMDEQGRYTFQDVKTPQLDEQFQEPGPNGLSFGWVAHPAWVKLTIGDHDIQERLYMVIEWPLLDDLTVYMLDENGSLVKKYQVGDQYRFGQRDIFDTHFVFPYENSIKTIYFRISTTSSLQLPIDFQSEKDYLKNRAYHVVGQGFFFGMMSVIIFYTLFLYVSTRRLAYLHYILFVLAFTIVQAGLKNTGFQYLWPNAPYLNDYAIATAGAFSLIFLNSFARFFLQIQENKVLMSINNVFLYLGGIFVVLSFILPYIKVIAPLAVTIIFSAFTVIGMAIYRYRQGFHEARFYLLAWLAMVAGSVTYLSKQLGLLPLNFITENSMQIGSALEVLLLSFALADRLNTLRSRLEETNANLEKQVKERTHELQIAMEELGDANRVLAELSATDKLTGLKNRHHFDTSLALELSRVKRSKKCVSLLLMDIDHFKKINDTHGHVVGDRAIQFVGDRLRSAIRRNLDNICRYGGEEFAVILPSTDAEGACQVAESVRANVENTDFVDNGIPIPMTVSIGVATIDHSAECDNEQLIRAADIALYNAKDDGRNCVHRFVGEAFVDNDYDKSLSEGYTAS